MKGNVGHSFLGSIEELYDDHSDNPVRVKVTGETMMFEGYVPPELGRKLKTGQEMIVTLDIPAFTEK